MSASSRQPPHLRPSRSVAATMGLTLLALLPGALVQTVVYGPGVLLQVVLAVLGCVLVEALILGLRKRPVWATLGDGSAVLAGALLGLCLPPLLPWPVALFAALIAMAVAKHAYGGLGHNPFNPAMAGYAAALVSVPAAFSLGYHDAGWQAPWAAVATVFASGPADYAAIAGATPLDALRRGLAGGLTATEALADNRWLFGQAAVALAYASGGLLLLVLRIIPWQTPVAVLVGLALPALIANLIGFPWPAFWWHWLLGASLLGAFFIATDPVSGSGTPGGRIAFGLGVGFLTWVIRQYGNYPDAFAFAILIMNALAPLLDRALPPRVVGR